MRLIRLKIDKQVAYKLSLLAKEMRTDAAFVQDAYALLRLKGNGIPSDARQLKIMDALFKKKLMTKLSARIHVRKRAQIYKDLTKLAYFTALARLSNPVFAVEKMLRQFYKLHRKVRQSQCEQCSLNKNCAFGQQYGKAVTDVTKVIDPDFSKKADPNCPHLPDIDYTNQLNESLKTMAALMNPQNIQQNQAVVAQLMKDKARQGITGDDESKDFSKASDELEDMHEKSDPEKVEEDVSEEVASDEREEEDYTPNTIGGYAKETGGGTFNAEYYVRVQEKMIEQMMKIGLDIFQLGQVLDLLLNKPGMRDFKPTDEMGPEHKPRNLETPADIVRADKTELAKPDDIVDGRIARKTLQVEKDLKPNKRRQLLYVSIDITASMRTQFNPNAQSIFSRASLCTVFATSLMKKVSADGGIVYLRFFKMNTSNLYVLDKPEDFDDMLAKLRDCDYNGSGTDIAHALRVALSDIDSYPQELSKATVLMITDADDSLTFTPAEEAALQARDFVVLDVSGKPQNAWGYRSLTSYAGTVLQRLAKKYYKCDEDALDPKKLVSLV